MKRCPNFAVLPLVNETGEPQAEYLSDGISESIINILSQLPRLRRRPLCRTRTATRTGLSRGRVHQAANP